MKLILQRDQKRSLTGKSVFITDATAELSPDELVHRFIIGVLADRDLPIYMDQYERIVSRAQAKRND